MRYGETQPITAVHMNIRVCGLLRLIPLSKNQPRIFGSILSPPRQIAWTERHLYYI